MAQRLIEGEIDVNGETIQIEYRPLDNAFPMRLLTKEEAIISETYLKIFSGDQADQVFLTERHWTTVRGDNLPMA